MFQLNSDVLLCMADGSRPNHYVEVVLTRWKRSPTGTVIERDGARVLEFLSIAAPRQQFYTLPGACRWGAGAGVGDVLCFCVGSLDNMWL